MHIQNRHAQIHHIHAVSRSDIGDGSAASHIDLAQLRGLILDIVRVKGPAQASQKFRAGVVGAALSSGTGVFADHRSLAHIGGIVLLKSVRVQGIVAGVHIGGKHGGIFQGPAQCQLAVLSQAIQHFCQGIFQETGLHTGGAHAANLFFIHKQADIGSLAVLRIQKCHQRGKSTDSVILSVSHDHAAVQSEISCPSCGNHFQLRGDKILLLHAVFFFQHLQKKCLHRLLLLLVIHRIASHQQIQRFALDYGAALFIHLLSGQVYQQVGDTHHRILVLFPDGKLQHGAVGADHGAVQRHGRGHPLIFFDTAVIMGIQIGQTAVLINGILLDIQSGGVDMGTDQIHSLLQTLLADLHQQNRLFHIYGIDLVACLQALSFFQDFIQIAVTVGSGDCTDVRRTFPLCLSGVQKASVITCHLLQPVFLRLVVLSHFSFLL